MTDREPTNMNLTTYRPCRADIDALIQRASKHRLGKSFLVDGSLDAVAATFGVHAFVVDAARQTLIVSAKSGEPKSDMIATAAQAT